MLYPCSIFQKNTDDIDAPIGKKYSPGVCFLNNKFLEQTLYTFLRKKTVSEFIRVD